MNIFQTGIWRRTALVLFKQGLYLCHDPAEVLISPLQMLRFQNVLPVQFYFRFLLEWSEISIVFIHIYLLGCASWCSENMIPQSHKSDTCKTVKTAVRIGAHFPPPPQSSQIAALRTICFISLLHALYFTYIDVLSPCQPAFMMPCFSFFSHNWKNNLEIVPTNLVQFILFSLSLVKSKVFPERVFHRPLSWLVHIVILINLWYKYKSPIRHRCQKGFNVVRHCLCAKSLEEKSSVPDLVGSWHWIIRCYTSIMPLIISRQKLSISPCLLNLEVATTKAVCHRDLIIFSCFIKERLCGELTCKTAPWAEVKNMPSWKTKSPAFMREHKEITQSIVSLMRQSVWASEKAKHSSKKSH